METAASTATKLFANIAPFRPKWSAAQPDARPPIIPPTAKSATVIPLKAKTNFCFAALHSERHWAQQSPTGICIPVRTYLRMMRKNITLASMEGAFIFFVYGTEEPTQDIYLRSNMSLKDLHALVSPQEISGAYIIQASSRFCVIHHSLLVSPHSSLVILVL